MQKTKKKPTHSSFVRLILVPCLILAQPVLLHAKAKKQEGGRAPAVANDGKDSNNAMAPILGCMKANEVATRRLSDPKWAVRGSLTSASAGLLVQTVEVKGQNGVIYKNDFAWILTPGGAVKVDVTGVPRNSESYLNQTLKLPFRKRIFGGDKTKEMDEEMSEETVVYTPGSDPKRSSNADEAIDREMRNLRNGPSPLLSPDLNLGIIEDRKKSDRGLNGKWMANDPDTRKVILDELKKRFNEFSSQSENERLAFAPQHTDLRSRRKNLEDQKNSLDDQLERYHQEFSRDLSNLENQNALSGIHKDYESRRMKVSEDLDKLEEDEKKVVSDLLKTQTLKDFIKGLRGCKSALEKDQWNQVEEFKSFHRVVVDNLQNLEKLERQARSGQTPTGRKPGAASATSAGQAQ